MARPTKFSPEIAARIIDAVRAGNYLETAAACAGLSKDTLYRWLKRGARAQGGAYRQFADDVAAALAVAEARDVATIDRAADGYDVVRIKETVEDGRVAAVETVRTREFAWQAAAWRLERKFPDRWGRRDQMRADVRTQGTVTHAGRVETEVTVDDPDRLAAVLAVLASVGALAPGASATGAGAGAAATADPLHPPPADADADRVPPAPAP